ncbi:hypothetical protein GCM10009796_08890 [Microbacterium koreense]
MVIVVFWGVEPDPGARAQQRIADLLELRGDLGEQHSTHGYAVKPRGAECHPTLVRLERFFRLGTVLVDRRRPRVRLDAEKISAYRRCGVRTAAERDIGESLVGEEAFVATDPSPRRENLGRRGENAVDSDGTGIEGGPHGGKQRLERLPAHERAFTADGARRARDT